MSERGIIIGGDVLPGTEFVCRSEDAWWREPSTDIYPRPAGKLITKIVGHWTGGHARTGEQAGKQLFDSMSARRKDSNGDGKITREDELMDVSVHFGIAWDGGIFQLTDLANAAIGAGRKLNLESIHVENMWPGLHSQAKRLGLPPLPAVRGFARGAAVKCYPPSDAMLASWRWLVRALTTASHPLLAIPMARGGDSTAGILEHCDSKVGRKLDAAGLLTGALGWR